MHKLSLDALRVKYENEPDALNALGVSTASQIIVNIPVTRSHGSHLERPVFSAIWQDLVETQRTLFQQIKSARSSMKWLINVTMLREI